MLGHLRIDNPRTRVSSGKVKVDLNEISCEDSCGNSGEVTGDLTKLLRRMKKNPPNQVKG